MRLAPIIMLAAACTGCYTWTVRSVTRRAWFSGFASAAGRGGWAAALPLAVAGASVTKAVGVLPVSAIAASPRAIAEGKFWLLVSSGLVVDHPVGASLVFFFALAVLALRVCGRGVFWRAAWTGHIIATLIVYAAIGVVRLINPGALAGTMGAVDYGVSAICAAWLGAVAAAAWRRRDGTAIGRAAIALSCLSVGAFAYSLRPELTVLSAEHVLAFAIGILAALRPRMLTVASGEWVWRVAAADDRVVGSP